MKTVLVLLLTIAITQAANPASYHLPSINELVLEDEHLGSEESRLSINCLVSLAKDIKEHGLNDFGPTLELGKDLYTTAVDLIKHVIKCRRLWYEDPTVWQEIQWQACRASIGAKAVYEVLRLKPILETAVQEDFWVQSILQLRQCLKREVETVKELDYEEILEKLDYELKL